MGLVSINKYFYCLLITFSEIRSTEMNVTLNWSIGNFYLPENKLFIVISIEITDEQDNKSIHLKAVSVGQS